MPTNITITDRIRKIPPGIRWTGISLTSIFLILLLIGMLNSSSDELDAVGKPTFTVKQGPLTISVTEAGTIRPREQIILKNEVEGQTVILFIIDEGKEVKKGDLLVELDASQLQDQRVNQQIQVINAEASFIAARENLEVVKSQAQADIDQASLDLEFASQDLKQYEEGEFPKQEKEAKAKITLAEETLTNAENTYQWSEKLFKEKYLSETELKRDELAWQKAKLDLDLARDALNLLQNFTYTRKMAELKSELKKTTMALDRVKRKAAADIAQAEAKLKASQAEYRQQQDKLDKIDTQITKTKIYAPMDGTVIYATSTKMSWRSSDEPLDEGQVVRERQELIYLPTTSSYNAEIKVHESSLKKIKTGLPVRVTIDALPGRIFTGKVASIAPLPDATSMFLNPDLKVYNSVIQIDGDGEDLRNGMSCQAEIIVEQFDNALFVPVQAVLLVGSQPTVYVLQEGSYKPRQVQAGLDNNNMVHITAGLKNGESVLLTPPLAAGTISTSDTVSPPPADEDDRKGVNRNEGTPPPKQKTDRTPDMLQRKFENSDRQEKQSFRKKMQPGMDNRSNEVSP